MPSPKSNPQSRGIITCIVQRERRISAKIANILESVQNQVTICSLCAHSLQDFANSSAQQEEKVSRTKVHEGCSKSAGFIPGRRQSPLHESLTQRGLQESALGAA